MFTTIQHILNHSLSTAYVRLFWKVAITNTTTRCFPSKDFPPTGILCQNSITAKTTCWLVIQNAEKHNTGYIAYINLEAIYGLHHRERVLFGRSINDTDENNFMKSDPVKPQPLLARNSRAET